MHDAAGAADERAVSYRARLLNPYHPRSGPHEWDLLLTDDGATVDEEGASIALPDVRVPLKFRARPNTATILAVVRRAVVVHGQRPQSEARALLAVEVDWPGTGTVVWRQTR